MMPMAEIGDIVRAALPGADVSVSDLTGGGDHFQVTVVSPAFEGRSLIEQHRMIQEPLRAAVDDGRIHALSIRTYTPAQWREKNRLKRT
jgi:acid stress-induced BolA-like protein IbaG/YrbA